MTYAHLHSLLFERLRESRAWPAASPGTKLTEQLQFIYAATLAVAEKLDVSVPTKTAAEQAGE